ncbi:MAG: hypothetical protein M9884_15715 [Rhodocyclaceae bacterium]|jgi:hypothetical protein|nr:hypothetical protein [Rhodocyclaceae bacterium]MCO5098898.1 hypothetical protein [Rhodocyclaceae bacterium]
MRLLAVFLGLTFASGQAAAFKFSEEEEKAKGDDQARAQRIGQLVSAPCKQQLKNKKIMLVIAERTANGYNTTQSRYGPHFQAINHRLRALGLKTYTQEEIRAQIAQAELEAHFRNDPDAAINASKKLGASFILRGLITTQTGINPVLKINEVAVHMGFTLVSAGGRALSNVSARDESYSGTDTLGMALTLVNEQADEVVAKLYNDYCRNAGTK